MMNSKIELVFDTRLFTFCLSFHHQSINQYRSFLFLIMSSRRFSPDEKKWLSFNFIKNGSNYVRDNWSEHFSTEAPSERSLFRYQKKLKEEGTLKDKRKSGRPRSVLTEENTIFVCQSVIEQNRTSTRRLSAELDISQTSIMRILKSNKFKSFIPRKVHQLISPDNESRLDFCNNMFSLYDTDRHLLSKIIWTDESIFKLSDTENRANTVYWSLSNPHIRVEHQLNQPGLMVWAGVCSQGVIGPYFFPNTVTGESYLDMLNSYVFPRIDQLNNSDQLIFQQDGAPAHYHRDVMSTLRFKFGSRFIGRGAPITWPPRSPDLTPMDYSIWGLVKGKVYARKPVDLGQLQQFIIDEFNSLNTNLPLLSDIISSVFDRLSYCLISDGHQFENLL